MLISRLEIVEKHGRSWNYGAKVQKPRAMFGDSKRKLQFVAEAGLDTFSQTPYQKSMR